MIPGHMDHPERFSDPDARPPEPGYETRDANVTALLRFGVGLVIATVLVEFAMRGFYRLFEGERPRPQNQSAPENLYQQLRQLRRSEDQALSSYAIDPRTGLARIPIERAMELVAEKGVPFGKGPKTELEVISHGGTPAPAVGKDAQAPPVGEGTGKPAEVEKTKNPPDTRK